MIATTLLRKAFTGQLRLVRRDPLLAFLVAVTMVCAIASGAQDGHLSKALAYIASMWLCAFLVDVLVLWRPSIPLPFPVRRPGMETFWSVLFNFIGIAMLLTRFVFLDWPKVPGLVRLGMLPLFGFVFPIALALFMLARKYSPRELGFRWTRSATFVLPVLLIVPFTALLVAPQELTLGELFRSEGVLGVLFYGFIVAALSEEFMRTVLQTRIGAFLKNNGRGWFLASLLWALMHTPKWYGEGHDAWGALAGALNIVPLGLMWGYLTHRTRSIFPAILAHGSNVWGLQNL